MSPIRAPLRAPEAWSFVTEWAEASPEAPRGEIHVSALAEPTFTCASCEAEIRGRATFHVGVAFCCAGCVAGGPCTCSYDPEPCAAGESASAVAAKASAPSPRDVTVRRIA
jgi:hypothetical protein